MLNSKVDLGYDGEKGQYIFAVLSNDGKSWMSYDVTELIAKALNYEIGKDPKNRINTVEKGSSIYSGVSGSTGKIGFTI